MGIVIRNRTIRPSTRKSTSVNYRVNVAKVLKDDILEVHVHHESLPFKRTYIFRGLDIADRNNISFKVHENANQIELQWSGVQPLKSENG